MHREKQKGSSFGILTYTKTYSIGCLIDDETFAFATDCGLILLGTDPRQRVARVGYAGPRSVERSHGQIINWLLKSLMRLLMQYIYIYITITLKRGLLLKYIYSKGVPLHAWVYYNAEKGTCHVAIYNARKLLK